MSSSTKDQKRQTDDGRRATADGRAPEPRPRGPGGPGRTVTEQRDDDSSGASVEDRGRRSSEESAVRRQQTGDNARFERSRRIATVQNAGPDSAERPTFRAFWSASETGRRAVLSAASPSSSHLFEKVEQSRAFQVDGEPGEGAVLDGKEFPRARRKPQSPLLRSLPRHPGAQWTGTYAWSSLMRNKCIRQTAAVGAITQSVLGGLGIPHVRKVSICSSDSIGESVSILS